MLLQQSCIALEDALLSEDVAAIETAFSAVKNKFADFLSVLDQHESID
jgi:hypothetical protein